MYWTIFWQPTVHVQQNIFEKLLKELVAHVFTVLLAHLASKLVNHSRHSETLKLSDEFVIDAIFLRKQRLYRFQTFFKDSLSLEKLTYLDVKDAKRSVNIWGTIFYKIFFRKYLVVHERSAVKNLFSTYVWSKVDSSFLRGIVCGL